MREHVFVSVLRAALLMALMSAFIVEVVYDASRNIIVALLGATISTVCLGFALASPRHFTGTSIVATLKFVGSNLRGIVSIPSQMRSAIGQVIVVFTAVLKGVGIKLTLLVAEYTVRHLPALAAAIVSKTQIRRHSTPQAPRSPSAVS